MPDPQYMTHINYAFGHVNESFNGVKIDNEERLRQIVEFEETEAGAESAAFHRRLGKRTFQ